MDNIEHSVVPPKEEKKFLKEFTRNCELADVQSDFFETDFFEIFRIFIKYFRKKIRKSLTHTDIDSVWEKSDWTV